MVRDWKREVKRYTKYVKGHSEVDFHNLLWYWSHVIQDKKMPQTFFGK
jgi:hypothetical protein